MMKKNMYLGIILGIFLLVVMFIIYKYVNLDEDVGDIYHLEAVIVDIDNDDVTLMDSNDIIYTLERDLIDGNVGDNILIEYTGILDSDMSMIEIVNYNLSEMVDTDEVPSIMDDNGLFSDYYVMAYNKLKELTLDEKIGQMLLVRYPDENIINDLEKYKFGGYVFFEKDFSGKNKSQVKEMINNVQNKSKIPLITAVDEEGGKIVRVSSNPLLIDEKFKSSKELFRFDGMDEIYNDTFNKSNFLFELGLNVNLAPVVDVSMNSNDYMYERSLGMDTRTTSLYAQTVIDASMGLGVSYVLKHFPGYGNNSDTHISNSIDNRSYESILENDIPPFKTGIDMGAEAVLVGHNIVNSIDGSNPASLSPKIHNLLRDDLNFTGVIITDDLDMGAISSIEDASVKAVKAGNNLIITTNYVDAFNSIKNAVNNGDIGEEMIDKLVFKVLSWKYYKGLMIDVK